MTTTDALPDALADALGRVIARERAEWRRDREVMVAESRQVQAELRAELALMRQTVRDCLATVKDGEPGMAGESVIGPEGPEGPAGPPGMLPVVAAWADGVHYAGMVVTHGGRTWQATRDTGREPPHEDWNLLADRGVDGADGRGFTIRGTWSEGADYAALDVVMLGGSSFVARVDMPGKCPGDGWQLLSAAGSRGKPGEPGARGVPGPAGRSIVSLSVNAEGVQTLAFDDGTSLTCDFYSVLARVR